MTGLKGSEVKKLKEELKDCRSRIDELEDEMGRWKRSNCLAIMGKVQPEPCSCDEALQYKKALERIEKTIKGSRWKYYGTGLCGDSIEHTDASYRDADEDGATTLLYGEVMDVAQFLDAILDIACLEDVIKP